MNQMKAMATPGGVAHLSVTPVPTPEPGPGEVRVRVIASAVNPAEQKVLGGEFVGNILHGKQQPLVTGWDLAGTVDAVGAGADLAVGDEVFGMLAYSRATRRGAFAEMVVAPAATLAMRPGSLPPTDAAALATAGLTALQGMRDVGGLKGGQQVLVVGASGGVGSLAVGVGSRLGATVTGVCSGSAAGLVRSLGATHIRERGKDPLGEPGQYHVIFDAASAHSWSGVRQFLAPGGAYVATLPGPGVFWGMAVSWMGGTRSAFVTVQPVRADLELLLRWVGEGMKIPIDSTFAVRDLEQAIARMARGGMKGRVVIQVDGGF